MSDSVQTGRQMIKQSRDMAKERSAIAKVIEITSTRLQQTFTPWWRIPSSAKDENGVPYLVTSDSKQAWGVVSGFPRIYHGSCIHGGFPMLSSLPIEQLINQLHRIQKLLLDTLFMLSTSTSAYQRFCLWYFSSQCKRDNDKGVLSFGTWRLTFMMLGPARYRKRSWTLGVLASSMPEWLKLLISVTTSYRYRQW